MSSKKNVQVIDCGATHVAAGVFSGKGGAINLNAFATEYIGCEFGDDEEWIMAVRDAVESIQSQLRLKGTVSIVLPGHLLLTKFLKIPHVGKSKRDQIVRFEAQQNIPFPLNEVVWDYEVVADDGTEFEVALYAVKLDVVDRLCSEIMRFGFEVELVEPSSMAQYNVFEHTHPHSDENVMVVNIGGKSANLLFMGQGGFFVRNTGYAGNALTEVIAEQKGCSLRDAEEAKWEYTVAKYEGRETDEEVGRQAEVFLRRFATETTRSVVNFRRQSGEEQIERLYLTGGGSMVPGLADLLGEKLELPVEFYDPLPGLTLGAKVETETVEAYGHHVGELFGVAVRFLGEPKTHFNLLPPPIARQLAFQKRKTKILVAAVLLVAAVTLPIYSAHHTTMVFQDNIAELDTRLGPLEERNREYQQIVRQIQEAEEITEGLRGLGESRANWIDFFADLQVRLTEVEDVWLERVEVVRGNGDMRGGAGPRQGGSIFRRPGDPQPSGAPRTGTAQEPGEQERVRLRISGRMLDRENPRATVSADTRARVLNLFEKIIESDYIAEKEGETFDTSEPGILRFQAVLVVNPERPL